MNVRPLRETEKIEIVKALLYANSAEEAARKLGIAVSTIYRKMKIYGISLESRPKLVDYLKSVAF